MFQLFDAYQQGNPIDLKPVPPYRDHIAWLRGRDVQQAEDFWRRLLSDFRTPTSLMAGQRAQARPSEQGQSRLEVQLTRQDSDELRRLARRHRLTLNTLMQGAWALLLSRYSGVESRPGIDDLPRAVGRFTNDDTRKPPIDTNCMTESIGEYR